MKQSSLPSVLLAVESSCDETAAALVTPDGELRANVISSQADLHAAFGGVVPEIASRRHLELVGTAQADALQHMSGDAIRFFLLSSHYRSPIDMGEWDPQKPLPNGMLSAKAAHDTFVRFAERVKRASWPAVNRPSVAIGISRCQIVPVPGQVVRGPGQDGGSQRRIMRSPPAGCWASGRVPGWSGPRHREDRCAASARSGQSRQWAAIAPADAVG